MAKEREADWLPFSLVILRAGGARFSAKSPASHRPSFVALFDEVDLVEVGPQLAGDKQTVVLCVVGDTVQYVTAGRF
jgi:hypothetical protein